MHKLIADKMQSIVIAVYAAVYMYTIDVYMAAYTNAHGMIGTCRKRYIAYPKVFTLVKKKMVWPAITTNA